MKPFSANFNRRQQEARQFMATYRPRHLILDGAIGSGKTMIALSLWISRIAVLGPGKTYIMTGYTLGSLKRNCLEALWERFGVNTDLDNENCFEIFGSKVYCFGTDKADSYKSIRGIMQAHGHYGNEITLSNRKAIEECFNRCRGEGAFFIWETNPDSPEHWIYQNFIMETIKNGNTKKIARFSFSLYDNSKEQGGFLDADYIKQQENLYSGIWHRQYIMGEWCTLEGQIYHLDNFRYYDDTVIQEKRWFFGGITHGYLDPAAGSKKKTGCFTSIISGCMKGPDIYIIDSVVRKWGVPEILKGLKGTTQNPGIFDRFQYSRFAYEDNFTQEEYVGRPIKEAYPLYPIQGQSSREDKLSRLISMQNIVETKVFFPERYRHERGSDGWLLLQQLCNITKERDEKAGTDEMFLDAPDALEGLIRSYRNYSGGKPIQMIGTGSDDVRHKQEW